MGPRAGISTVLVLGSIVLLFAIVVGQSMGNHVLGQIASHPSALTETAIPTPTSSAAEGGPLAASLWKRRQVISVATDPAFPDPRITPEPTPSPSPKPTPKPTPSPTDSPFDLRDDGATPTLPPVVNPPNQTGPDASGAPDAGASGQPSPAPSGHEAPSVRGQAPRPASPAHSAPTLPPYTTTPLP